MTVFTKPEHFDYRQNQYLQYAAAGFPECDPEFIPVLKKLNQIPGLCTAFCCTGHPDKPEIIDGEECYDTHFYVVFGVLENGMDSLLKVFGLFRESVRQSYDGFDAVLIAGQLTVDGDDYWNCWTIEGQVFDVVMSARYLEALESAADQVLSGLNS